MNRNVSFLNILSLLLLFALFNGAQADPADQVAGNLIQFNDNGGWCWYQDERAVVDIQNGSLIVGCVENGDGVGGRPRQGDIVAVFHDLGNGMSQRYLMKNALTSFGGGDDHNAPAFLILPNGTLLSCYAGHNNNTITYYRIHDGEDWGLEQRFNWNTEIPGGSNFNTTYSNLFYLSTEGRIYNIARCDERSPNMMISDDLGETWSYGGLLTQPDVTIGYVNGYFKYWSNGIDRIDFICTEHHPRDFNTSMYHGYVQGGQTFRSDGTLMDTDISDQSAPNPDEYTLMFAANTELNGMTMTRLWDHDVQRYADGSIAALIKARINDSNPPSNNPEHAFLFCRYDGQTWSTTYLSRAGRKLYSSEQDYTGLGALDPDDPNTIYISTPRDPRDDANLGVHEIFKGVTSDQGATWSWTPITRNSTRDNMRPIIPAWDSDNTALLWWRGTYSSAQIFDSAIVGLIERASETAGLMTYTDADASNTAFANGNPLSTTGPDGNQGPGDDQWHERTGYGNGGSVLTSSEIDGEDAPMLKTSLVPESGAYDVWVNFWANPDSDWRIVAGLSADRTQIFRHMACQQVEEGMHDSPIVLSGDGNTELYQAYLGRVHRSGSEPLEVFIDDYAVETGTENHVIGNSGRTWYDGVSLTRAGEYNAVQPLATTSLPESCALNPNYPNPFNASTVIEYQMDRQGSVRLDVFNLAGQRIRTLVHGVRPGGTHRVTWHAGDAPSGTYFCRLTTERGTRIQKMMLLK